MMSTRLIDANVLLESGIYAEYGYNDNGLLLIPMRDVINSIRNAPTIDAEPVRHGRWIYGITLNHEWRKCSECLVSQDIFGCFTYCPNCGAKMDGEAN